jgi:hypothetical protein
MSARIILRRFIYSGLASLLFIRAASGAIPAAQHGWWPAQALPAALVCTTPMASWPGGTGDSPMQMLVQSVAGLAAQAVNARTGDELVWVTSGNIDIEEWGRRFRVDHPSIVVRDTLPPWSLVERYARRGLIKGYVLYRFDRSQPVDGAKLRPDMDLSVNVATSVAGILGGILVDESLEAEAKKHGLSLLLDARGKTQQWCFDTYRDRFTRQMLLAMDPKMAEPRDYAIAHRAFAVFGHDEPLPSALAWLDAPAPVLGWIGGDEFRATELATIHGDFQTATSRCLNLPVLMAGALDSPSPQVPHLDPQRIDWSDHRSTVSLLSSDGDNVLFLTSGFFQRSPYYWSASQRGKVAFGWSAPLAHLVQLCPQAIEYAVATRTPNDWLVEWHGGYYYPDLYASARPDRWELLAQHARDTWAMMQRSGATMIGFNMRHYDSPDALKAYATIIGQTDRLLAVLAFQYSPYNAGAGRVFWFKDQRGVEVPVITLRYQIWWNLNHRANTGTPAKIAREIRESVERIPPAEPPRNDWGMEQVWSYFKPAPGTDEDAENLPPKKEMTPGTTYEQLGGVRGYAPVTWCTDRLPSSVRVVAPEEMAWRVRMAHDPQVTRRLIDEYR